jgi:hypothetical protein
LLWPLIDERVVSSPLLVALGGRASSLTTIGALLELAATEQCPKAHLRLADWAYQVSSFFTNE